MFFIYGIINLSDNQENEFCRIFEVLILKKLGLSVKFSYTLIYVDRKAMGLGLFRPTTIIIKPKEKLYIIHHKIDSETYNAIEILHEILQFNSGRIVNIYFIPQTQRY